MTLLQVRCGFVAEADRHWRLPLLVVIGAMRKRSPAPAAWLPVLKSGSFGVIPASC